MSPEDPAGDGGRGGTEGMAGTLPGPREADLSRALRRAAEEAAPRPEFRVRLRAAFATGGLQPSGEPDPAAPRPALPARPLPVPRWAVYPAAAALLLAAVALSGALEPRAVAEPVAPLPRRLTAPEEALVAAERRLAVVEGLGGRRYEHRVVEGRPVLLPAEAAFADGDELRLLALSMAGAETLLAQELPGAAARWTPPLVTVVAPSRRLFEELAGREYAPVPVAASTVACALRESGVLLLSPGVLEPGGPPCEEMDVVHESVHGWLQARARRDRPLPLWVEEGVAGIVSQAGAFDTREWCRNLLAAADSGGVDPVFPAEVLEMGSVGELARVVRERAPCDDRPWTMLPVFHAQAESLVMFLLEDHPGCFHRAGFLAWLEGAMDGTADTEAFATAREFGFESPEALFRARDQWLGEGR